MAPFAHDEGAGGDNDDGRRNGSSLFSNLSSTSTTGSTAHASGIQASPPYPTHRHLDIYPSHASDRTLENNTFLNHSAQRGSGSTDDWSTYDSQDPVPSILLDVSATLGLPVFDNTAHLYATASLPSSDERSRDSLAWPDAGRRTSAEAIAAGDTQPDGTVGGGANRAPSAEGEKHWSLDDMHQAETEEQNRQRKVDQEFLKPIAGDDEDEEGDVVMTDTQAAQRKEGHGDDGTKRLLPAAPDPERRVLEFGPHWELVSGPLPHSTAIIKHYLDTRQPVDIDRLRDFLEHVSASMPTPEAFNQFVVALRMWITRQISYEALVDWLVYFFSAKPDLLERSNVLLGTIAKLTSAVVEPDDPARPKAQGATSGDAAITLSPHEGHGRSGTGSSSGTSSATPSADTGRVDASQLRDMRSPSSGASSATTPSSGSGTGKGAQPEADQRAADATAAAEDGTPSPPPGKVEIDIVYSCPLGVYKRRIVLDQSS